MTTKIDDFIKRVESTAEEDLFTPRIFYHLSSSMFHEMCELLKEHQEIVRCNECKYARHDYVTGAVFCTKLTEKYTTQDDKSVSEYWYCADGEKRTDDT